MAFWCGRVWAMRFYKHSHAFIIATGVFAVLLFIQKLLIVHITPETIYLWKELSMYKRKQIFYGCITFMFTYDTYVLVHFADVKHDPSAIDVTLFMLFIYQV